MKANLNKSTEGTFIQSVEASIVWEHVNRGASLTPKYDGFIPYSLELIKLRELGINEFANRKDDKVDIQELDRRTMKTIRKFHTDDIINVKFKSKVSSAKTVLKKVEDSQARTLESFTNEHGEKPDFEERLAVLNEKFDTRNEEIAQLIEANKDAWETTLSLQELRNELYVNGFTLTNYKGEKVKYVVYKRSSAKSRIGSCLFIREDIAKKITNWSRMGINFENGEEIDIASLSAYESLVTSSLKGTIKINPKHILLIDDVDSVFNMPAIEIVKDTVNGKVKLKSQTNENATISNSLFDGSGLLDSQYFNGQGMMLLRQHFFKSCVFNTNVVDFMKDQFGSEYETATIKDMLGNKVKVKDIHMIITPSSLKVFKFSRFVGTDKDMYNHWKKTIKAEKNTFGVCKSESSTKLGYDENGMPLQQMSYQMVNSLDLDINGIQELSKFEVDYINTIKNDDEAFAQHLLDTATMTNSNEMLANLFYHNNDIAKTELFNTFKRKTINKYVAHMKQGKIRITGDYAVLIGNPIEFLYSAIGKFDVNDKNTHHMNGNQIYNKNFKNGEEVVCFRNPHTSANNLLYAINTKNTLIDKYFNFTNNIVAVNAIEFPVQDILSGCDYDSDTMLITNNKTIVEVARNNDAKVCLNGVSATSNRYVLDSLNRAKVDKTIASELIGMVVNVGQTAQSVMYDAKLNGHTALYKEMKEVVEIISVLSTIAIDGAKKAYDIDAEKELIRLSLLVKSRMKQDDEGKSLFPSFMNNGRNHKRKYTSYKTAMDYVVDIFDVRNRETAEELTTKIRRAKELKSSDVINMFELVMPFDIETGEIFQVRNANNKQENEIISMVDTYTDKMKHYKTSLLKANSEEKGIIAKKIVLSGNIIKSSMKKRTIKATTIFSIMYHLFESNTIEDNQIQIMNAVYQSEPKKFLSVFEQK